MCVLESNSWGLFSLLSDGSSTMVFLFMINDQTCKHGLSNLFHYVFWIFKWTSIIFLLIYMMLSLPPTQHCHVLIRIHCSWEPLKCWLHQVSLLTWTPRIIVTIETWNYKTKLVWSILGIGSTPFALNIKYDLWLRQKNDPDNYWSKREKSFYFCNYWYFLKNYKSENIDFVLVFLPSIVIITFNIFYHFFSHAKQPTHTQTLIFLSDIIHRFYHEAISPIAMLCSLLVLQSDFDPVCKICNL